MHAAPPGCVAVDARSILDAMALPNPAPSGVNAARRHTSVETPIGEVTLVSDGARLVGVYLDGQKHRPDEATFGVRDDDAAPFPQARAQLAEYFAGDRTTFDLPLAPAGTPFQQDVWAALDRIPYGQTWTYAQLADEIGQPSASRAVGAAVGRNPVCVVVPCHRVVGANGDLTGYAGGVDRKRALLDLEREHASG